MKKSLLTLAFSFIVIFSFAQINLWEKLEKPSYAYDSEFYYTETSSTNFYSFELTEFQELSKNGNNLLISLPIGNNEFADFKLTGNSTMSKGLMEKYPNIRTFNGVTLEGEFASAKIDVSSNYFRAMIMRPGKPNLYIDPIVYVHSPQTEYVLYSKEELLKENDFSCTVEAVEDYGVPVDFNTEKAIQSCELRTYRIAIAATGEYTIYHGGTVEDAMGAIVTTLNRVNGIYETDLSVTMTLVPNNDLIVFTDPQSDPYSNGNTGAMISQNPSVLNNNIGSSNYDIGHVFGKDSGGLAYLSSVCTNNKARGVTGGSNPVGDAFDIDYVCHEVGHQFGANHSFNNSCDGNRNNSTAMEPGSASTIMGYAGICHPNVHFNSDSYFHAVSLREIGNFLNSSTSGCAVKTSIGNTQPMIISTTNSMTIPKGTPFIVSAEAEDLEDQNLTYTFEQMDKEITQQPPSPTAVKGPNFRSMKPSEDSYRYIPSIRNRMNDDQWERLSDVARTFKFRVTVRDNFEGGGCTDYEDFTVSVDASTGPFKVTYPTTTGITWEGLTTETVTWDVAGTDGDPINCQNVKILITTDLGETFETLLESTPNTGSAEVVVPNVTTNKALILVKSDNNQFFDVSIKRFKINANTSGIHEENFASVQLYPNPTDGIVRIDLSGNETLSGYSIFDISGKLIRTSRELLANQESIDISSFDSGVYFFQTEIKGQRVVVKLIKE